MVGVFRLILLRKRVRSIVRFSESIDQQETPPGDRDEAQEGSPYGRNIEKQGLNSAWDRENAASHDHVALGQRTNGPSFTLLVLALRLTLHAYRYSSYISDHPGAHGNKVSSPYIFPLFSRRATGVSIVSMMERYTCNWVWYLKF